jgi:hypothetical protein
MKRISSQAITITILILATLLLSACGAGTGAATVGAVQSTAAPAAYRGIVDSISGNQWTVNGQTITVDPSVVLGGPFNAGDPIRIEGSRDSPGSFKVTRVSIPSGQDLSALPLFGSDDNSNGNGNTNSNANSNANANANTNANANANANATATANANANTNANVNLNTNTNTNTNLNTNANGNDDKGKGGGNGNG